MTTAGLNLASPRILHSLSSPSYKILRTDESNTNKDDNEDHYFLPHSPNHKPKYSFTGHPLKTEQTSKQIINKISDFYSRNQVKQAVVTAKNKVDRVKVLDMILKRRDEMKEAENKIKIEKAGPILKLMCKNYKNKSKYVTYEKGSKFRKQIDAFQQEDEKIGNERQSFTTKHLTTISADLNNIPSYLATSRLSFTSAFDRENHFRAGNFSTSPANRSPRFSHRNTLQIPQLHQIRHSILQPILASEQDSMMSNSNLDIKDTPTSPLKNMNPSMIYSYLDDPNKRASLFYSKDKILDKFKAIICTRNNSRNQSERLPTEEIEKKLLHLQAEEEGRKKSVKNFVSRSVFDDARKKLEIDLYKHMILDGAEGKGSIHTMRSGDSPKIKTIESGALELYKNYKKDQLELFKCRKAPKGMLLTNRVSDTCPQKSHRKLLKLNRNKSNQFAL